MVQTPMLPLTCEQFAKIAVPTGRIDKVGVVQLLTSHLEVSFTHEPIEQVTDPLGWYLGGQRGEQMPLLAVTPHCHLAFVSFEGPGWVVHEFGVQAEGTLVH